MHRILLREVVIDCPATAMPAARRFWAAALDAEAETVKEAPEFTALRDPAATGWVGLQDVGDAFLS